MESHSNQSKTDNGAGALHEISARSIKAICGTLMTMFMAFIASGHAFADTLHVPGEYSTIQAAIDAASDGDIVLIADGTYTGVGNRDIDFLGKAITVQSENGAANCIIDCEHLGRAFIFQNGESESSVLQGITITNGYTYGIVDPEGGSIRCESSSPRFVECRIENSSTGDSGPVDGGAIAVYSGTLQLEACVVMGSTCFGRGGGAFVENGDAIITNSTFQDNGPGGGEEGGALYVDGYCQIIRSTFQANSNHEGGAAVWGSGSFIECVFNDNEGGLFTEGGAVKGDGVFVDCSFVRNYAGYDSDGGAVSGHGVFVGCLFEENDALAGGAVFGSGEFYSCIFTKNGCNAVRGTGQALYFEDCTFTENIGCDASGIDYGGAVLGSGRFVRCTFDANYTPQNSDGGGGAVAGDGEFIGCVFQNNVSGAGPGGAVLGSGSFVSCWFEGNAAGPGEEAGTGGAVYCDDVTIFKECTFLNNTVRSGNGGAINVSGDYCVVDQCAFEGNIATAWGSQEGLGGAVYVSGSNFTITQSTISANTADRFGGAVHVAGPGIRLQTNEFCENTPDHVDGPWVDLGGNTFSESCDCLQLDVQNLVADDIAIFTITGGAEGEKGVTVYGTQSGQTVVNDVFGYCATFEIKGVNESRVISGFNRVFDTNGEITFGVNIPGNASGLNVLFQAAKHGTCPEECMSNLIEATIW